MPTIHIGDPNERVPFCQTDPPAGVVTTIKVEVTNKVERRDQVCLNCASYLDHGTPYLLLAEVTS